MSAQILSLHSNLLLEDHQKKESGSQTSLYSFTPDGGLLQRWKINLALENGIT